MERREGGNIKKEKYTQGDVCRSSSEENVNRYKSLKNKAKNTVDVSE